MGMVDVKRGLRILIDGDPWLISDVDFVKPGKGQAFNKLRLKNLKTGAVLERTLKSNEKVEETEVVENEMQYLYNDGTNFIFMNTETYDQVSIPAESVGDSAKWIKEEDIVEVAFFQGEAIAITLPNFVILKITQAEGAVRGNTANRVTKNAVLETGAEISVPSFVDEGELIKIDTRTGEYVERAKE
ncbi:MAG: elongation factor P [Fibrobacterota bacterium]